MCLGGGLRLFQKRGDGPASLFLCSLWVYVLCVRLGGGLRLFLFFLSNSYVGCYEHIFPVNNRSQCKNTIKCSFCYSLVLSSTIVRMYVSQVLYLVDRDN